MYTQHGTYTSCHGGSTPASRLTQLASRHTTHLDSRPWTYDVRLRGPTMYGKNVVHPQVEDGLCHRLVLGLPREAVKTSPSSARGLHKFPVPKRGYR